MKAESRQIPQKLAARLKVCCMRTSWQKLFLLRSGYFSRSGLRHQIFSSAKDRKQVFNLSLAICWTLVILPARWEHHGLLNELMAAWSLSLSSSFQRISWQALFLLVSLLSLAPLYREIVRTARQADDNGNRRVISLSKGAAAGNIGHLRKNDIFCIWLNKKEVSKRFFGCPKHPILILGFNV